MEAKFQTILEQLQEVNSEVVVSAGKKVHHSIRVNEAVDALLMKRYGSFQAAFDHMTEIYLLWDLVRERKRKEESEK